MNNPDSLTEAQQVIQSGDIKRAFEMLQANLGDKKHYLETRLTLAELYLRQGKYDSAKCHLLDALTHTQNHVHTLTLLAYIARKEGKFSDATEHLHRASRNQLANQEQLKLIALEFLALRAYKLAIHTLERVEPMDAKSFYNLGYAHFKLGQIGKALPIYRKLFDSIPDSPTIARELSLISATFRDYDTAIESYSRYMQLVQPGASDFLKFSDLQLLSRNIAESEKHLAKAIAMGEDSVEAHLLEAKLARLRGDYNKALCAALAVVKAQPQSGPAWKIISELIDSCSIEEELTQRLSDAIASTAMTNQDRELAQFAMAELQVKFGDIGQAYSMIQSANHTKRQSLLDQGIRYNRKSIETQFDAIKRTFQNPTALQASENPHSPVFIVGMPRSGTTLINRLLASSGKLNCIGESEAISFIYSQLQFQHDGSPEEFAKKQTRSQWDLLAADYLQRVKAAELEVADKMPHNFLHIGMILSMFPKARIIQLRRNAFDVCMSIYAKPFPEGHHYACDAKDLSHFFFRSNELMDFWSQKYPENIFNLDFDQFVETPAESGERLFSFLGYAWSDDYLKPPQKNSQAFTFSELQVRKPIMKSEAEKWRAFAPIATDLSEAIETEAVLRQSIQ